MDTIQEESQYSINQSSIDQQQESSSSLDVSSYCGRRTMSSDNQHNDSNSHPTDEYCVGRKRQRIDESQQIDKSVNNSKQQPNDSTDIDISRMCCAEQPVESTRMSNDTSNNDSLSLSYLDQSCFKTILFEEDEEDGEVSIISRVVNLILSISFDFKKVLMNSNDVSMNNSNTYNDETVMRAICSMKTVRDLTSTLCSVHEAVGLKDLKILSHAFKDEVGAAWSLMKKFATQGNKNNSTNSDPFKEKMLRLLELVGALSLAAVDHIAKGEGRLYISQQYEGELSIYFLKHQNRFLLTMLEEVSATVSKGIDDMKKYQLSSDHEMSEDIVDSVMNVLTSMATLFQQCENLLLVFLRSVQQCAGEFYAEECFHLRNILTDIIDYNENLSLIVEKSKLVAKNCDALEQFLDVPVILADITKSICNSAGDLIAYTTSKKTLDEPVVDALYESLEKFVFSGKTIRVGVSMLVQEVEKDLNVAEDRSIVQLVQNDASVAKRGSLCPMNTSQIGVDSLPSEMKPKFKDHRRSSNVRCEQYVSRYMDLSSISEK